MRFKRTFIKTTSTFLFFMLLFLCNAVLAADNQVNRGIDPNLEKLSWSGFLRTRMWHVASSTSAGDFKGVEKGQATYQDLFFRNRFYLDVMPQVEVRSVFDVFNVFGEDGAALGNGETNLVTRDVYFIFKPSDTIQVSMGLMPYSLPGGYILARDGSGLKYEHSFLNGRLKPYLYYIKAIDNSKESSGKGFGTNNQADDDIYTAGLNFATGSAYSFDMYFVHEDDLDDTKDIVDNQDTGSLNWAGWHNRFIYGSFEFDLGGIYNWGFIRKAPGTEKKDISAALAEFKAGYRLQNFNMAMLVEGATGDINDAYDGESFQQIKASHGLSRIMVDNSGGVAIRGSGTSQLYGMTAAGLQLGYTLFGEINMQLTYLRFMSTRDLVMTNTPNHETTKELGDEVNYIVKYIPVNNMSFFLESAVFWPGRGYTAWVSDTDRKPVIEVMLGAQVDY